MAENTNANANATNTQNSEELLTRLAEAEASNKKLQADYTRIKTSLDKALKEKGDITKALRAKQTAEEQEEEASKEAKAQHDAYVAELEAYKAQNEAKNRYLLQGMDAEMAKEAAKAEISGDMDSLAKIQKKYTENALKKAQAEWLKSRPQVSTGSGATMTKAEIMAISDPVERQRAIAQNLDLFTK